MAIDPVVYPETDRLVLPEQSFYFSKIPVSHWQLRHYLSHPEPDVLYFASANRIYYLNTSTKQRKHIATLPFEARCTASGHGYVCVGGETDGRFAVIKLEYDRAAEVDAAVSLDLWQANRGTPQAASVKVERIGEEIVNSISIHQIHDDDAHLHDVVAVLTNNDKTVRVYSLTHGIETAVLHLPDAMNHATISPDGNLLAAVGDINAVYFYGLSMREEPPQIPKPHNRLNTSSARWDYLTTEELFVPGPGTHKGYFTTAWSQSGHLLAVGSEAGYITVFDMDIFRECECTDVEASYIVTIPSSRPDIVGNCWPGAVRAMQFAPEPWDLLIWAEDQGRICVGDLRTGLRTKQVVHLDVYAAGLNRFDISDVSLSPEATRRVREVEEALRQEFYDAMDYGNELSARTRQHNRLLPRFASRFTDGPENGLTNDLQGLTNDEQLILESLRVTRQRQELIARTETPRSINYTSASMFDRPNDGAEDGTSGGPSPYAVASRRSPPGGNLAPAAARSTTRQGGGLNREPRPGRSSNEALRDYHEQFAEIEQRNLQRMLRAPREGQDVVAADEGRHPDPLPQNANHEAVLAVLRRQRQARQAHERERSWQQVADSSANGRPGPDLQDDPIANLTPREAENRRRIVTARQEANTPPGNRAVPPHALRATDGTSAQARDEAQNEVPNEDAGPWRVIVDAISQARDMPGGSNADPEARALYQRIDHRRRPNNASGARVDASESRTGAERNNDHPGDPRPEARGFEGNWELLRRRSLRRNNAGGMQLTGVEVGVRTAGLAISRDGRTVWVATEEGIFELALDFKQRAQMPAVEIA